MLRETLGWLDKQGNPRRQDIEISFRDFIEKAGVSRGAIGKAIQDAVAGGFIECKQSASKKTAAGAGQSGSYSLRWNTNGPYTKSMNEFTGFYTGEGNRTSVPNQFFDAIVCNEPLSLIKVVGTIIRQTIGYRNQFGGRRSTHPLSYSRIQRLANLKDRSVLSDALQVAEKTGYIICVDRGQFTPDKQLQKQSCYGLRWLQERENPSIGTKIRPEPDGFKKPTSIGSKFRPEDRFKKPTSKKKTELNDNNKQQNVAAVDDEAVQLLASCGLDIKTAIQLFEKRGVEAIKNQVEWLDARKPTDNRIGMLRKSIEDDWPMPVSLKQRQRTENERAKQAKRDERQRREDAVVTRMKQQRADRKLRLLVEWESASRKKREQWIRSAVKAEASKKIAELIRRQTSDTETPHVHVLQVVAGECNLPPVLMLEQN